MKRTRTISLLAAGGLLLLAGCGETMPSGPSSTTDISVRDATAALTAANDGLSERDISGLSATDLVTAGTGTATRSAETISVDLPSDAVVQAVYLYWARRGLENDPAPPEIHVDGNPVTGSVVGGPVDTPDDRGAAISFRADITGMGLVGPGASSFTVRDDPRSPAEPLGASVLVLYSTSSPASDLVLFDGVDFLWAVAPAADPDQREALRTAVPITFEFDPADAERTAELALFIGDVEDPDRPNSLEITVGGGSSPTETIGPSPSAFQAFQGAEWDNFLHTVTIPAGVSQVTVEPVSGPGTDPASLVWSLAALSVEPAENGGGEGCTPGYWRQSHHFDDWVGHAPDDDLGSVFTLPADLALESPEQRTDPDDLSLHDGLVLRGGGVNALIRHAVAALLNAASPDVSYDLDEATVVSMFNDAVDGGDVEGTKDELVELNEQGCPPGGGSGDDATDGAGPGGPPSHAGPPGGGGPPGKGGGKGKGKGKGR